MQQSKVLFQAIMTHLEENNSVLERRQSGTNIAQTSNIADKSGYLLKAYFHHGRTSSRTRFFVLTKSSLDHYRNHQMVMPFVINQFWSIKHEILNSSTFRSVSKKLRQSFRNECTCTTATLGWARFLHKPSINCAYSFCLPRTTLQQLQWKFRSCSFYFSSNSI